MQLVKGKCNLGVTYNLYTVKLNQKNHVDGCDWVSQSNGVKIKMLSFDLVHFFVTKFHVERNA